MSQLIKRYYDKFPLGAMENICKTYEP